MKDIWRRRYQEADLSSPTADVLTGFNANIDIKYSVEDLDLDLEDVKSRKIHKVSGKQDFLAVLKYCMEKGENLEVDYRNWTFNAEGDESVGGQAGIMSNYLADTGNKVVFYTPFLSERLAYNLNEKILYPFYDGSFRLENIRDAVNTDRDKTNLIFEFDTEKTGRLILSDRLRGFGPYFRKGVEENLEKLDEKAERILLSGFHNADGNVVAKIRKASEQLAVLETPIHMEYVDLRDNLEMLEKHIFPRIDSIGLDEYEMKSLEDELGLSIEGNQSSLGEAYQFAKHFIEEYGLSRVHIHTYSHHLTVTEKDYPVSKEKIRESMLYGETSAIAMAEKGEIPGKVKSLEFDNCHVKKIDELEAFGNFFDLEDFAETGIGEVEGYNVVAIPPVIHEDPARLVGMGDIISSGTFVKETD